MPVAPGVVSVLVHVLDGIRAGEIEDVIVIANTRNSGSDRTVIAEGTDRQRALGMLEEAKASIMAGVILEAIKGADNG